MKGWKKIKSYTGFAIKAGKAVFGVDNIIIAKKHIHLILFDDSLGDAGKRKLLNTANNNNIEYCQLDIKEVITKENCKAIGIKEKNLAHAIIQVIKERLI